MTHSHLLPYLKGRLADYASKVGVAPVYVLPVRRQVAANEAHAGVVQLHSDGDATLVPHHAHDADANRRRVHVRHGLHVSRLDEHAKEHTHEVNLGYECVRLSRVQSLVDLRRVEEE